MEVVKLHKLNAELNLFFCSSVLALLVIARWKTEQGRKTQPVLLDDMQKGRDENLIQLVY